MVALLGCGGMGEVYRAEDLRLGQPVALKFLPDALAQDRETLEGFYAEVRIGRQVAHRNVCRLYDLIEVDGHHALSMEYVDGEDLASLLRRIGRLPEQKGFEVAREICAGLAAARERGVIHRDLKPANVMFDSRARRALPTSASPRWPSMWPLRLALFTFMALSCALLLRADAVGFAGGRSLQMVQELPVVARTPAVNAPVQLVKAIELACAR